MNVNEVRVSGFVGGVQFKPYDPAQMPVEWAVPHELVPGLRARFILSVYQPKSPVLENCIRIGPRALCRPRMGDVRMRKRLSPSLFCEAWGPLALYLHANLIPGTKTPIYVEGSLINAIRPSTSGLRARRRHTGIRGYDGLSGVLVQRIELLDGIELRPNGRISLEQDEFGRIVEELERYAPGLALLPKLRKLRERAIHYDKRILGKKGQEASYDDVSFLRNDLGPDGSTDGQPGHHRTALSD